MRLVKFGEYEPTSISEYEVEVSDVDASGSGRSESGKMNRDRVRGGDDPVYKLSISCTNITDSEMKALLEAVKDTSINTTFYFGEYLTKEMYAGNRKISLKLANDGEVRWDVSLSMVQY